MAHIVIMREDATRMTFSLSQLYSPGQLRARQREASRLQSEAVLTFGCLGL